MGESNLFYLSKLEKKLNGSFIQTENIDIIEWIDRKTLQYELQNDLIIKIKINYFQLDEIPSEVYEFKDLQELSFSYNNIKSISNQLCKLTNLTTLILCGNQISDLPSNFIKLKKLKKLDLSFNHFKKIPYPIFKLTQLERLNFASNKIESIAPQIKDLTELNSLWLSNNKISTIPFEISYLNNLKSLYLANNEIKLLPKFITNISCLKEIGLTNNPIKQPPPEIIELGKNDIFEYLKQLPSDDAGIEFFEAKLIIVGEGNVGKTCLTKRLSQNLFEKEEETTRGISISEWGIKSPSQANFIRLNIWDFGGQEIYYATHQFFLTSRSVYILVWNARRTRDYENINYWLHTIEAFSNNSPVLIVMTKLSERDDDLNMRDLREQFPQIAGFLKVDNEDCSGIENLKRIISETAWSLPQMGDKWIERWLTVRHKLEKETRKWITYDDYLNICKENSLSLDESKTLSEYLHNLGVILNFSDNLILRNYVIIQPEWATNAIYNALDFKDVILNEGILNHNQLDLIWDNEIYPKNVYPFILELMNKFELAYLLPDKQTHLIPQLLPSTEPEHDWQIENNLIFFYKYNFLPIGIIPRFIVRMHSDIDIYNNKHLCWREGLILNRKNTKAYIKVKPFDKLIQISIEGENCRELLSIVRYNFENIHKSISKIEVREQVPCSCNSDCKKLWEYKNLLKLEKKGINEITCEFEGNSVSVKYLLDGYEEETTRNSKENNVYNINNIITNNSYSTVTFNVEVSNYLSDLNNLKQIFQNDFDQELFEFLNDLCLEVDEIKNSNYSNPILGQVIEKTTLLIDKLKLTRVFNLLKTIDKGVEFVGKIEQYLSIFKEVFK